jgi:hypothetical protein
MQNPDKVLTRGSNSVDSERANASGAHGCFTRIYERLQRFTMASGF